MSEPGRRRPALLIAAGLLALQGVTALVVAVLEIGELDPARPGVGIGVSLIMLGAAVLLAVVARGVGRARRWSRSLAVVTQLILLLLGWGFRRPPTTVVGLVFVLVALTALVCVLLPSSTRAFLGEEPAD